MRRRVFCERQRARTKFTARLRNHFDFSLCPGAMIDAPPADSFNSNKEIGRDSW
jgi:hypothetical protein